MSFGSSKAATPVSTPASVAAQQNSVIQAAASPAAQPAIAPPPIPLPPPAANSPVLGSAFNGASSTFGMNPGVFSAEGNIATSPQGDPTKPTTAKATLLGK